MYREPVRQCAARSQLQVSSSKEQLNSLLESRLISSLKVFELNGQKLHYEDAKVCHNELYMYRKLTHLPHVAPCSCPCGIAAHRFQAYNQSRVTSMLP